jgi:hypothetical protein
VEVEISRDGLGGGLRVCVRVRVHVHVRVCVQWLIDSVHGGTRQHLGGHLQATLKKMFSLEGKTGSIPPNVVLGEGGSSSSSPASEVSPIRRIRRTCTCFGEVFYDALPDIHTFAIPN